MPTSNGVDGQDQNQTNNVMPVPPAPNKTRQPVWWVWFVVLLVLIGVVLWAVLARQTSPAPSGEQNKSAATSTVPAKPAFVSLTAEQEQKNLLGKEQIVVPDIQQSADITAASLPKELAGLILSGATNVQIKKLAFTGGSSGYGINYSYAGSVPDTGRLLYKATSGWQFIAGGFGNLVSYVERQSQTFKVKINITPSGDESGVQIFVVYNK